MNGRRGPFWKWSDEQRDALLRQLTGKLALPLAVLALIWVIIIVIELANLVPANLVPYVYTIDIAIWGFFLAEFALEFAIAPRKLEYLRSNWVAALSVLLPFFGVLRIARAVAALRSLALTRALLSANRATQAAADILGRGRFQYVALVALLATVLGAAAVSFFERTDPRSSLTEFPQALWWAATMITTINTGTDPLTAEGRIIAIVLRIVALSIFGYLTAQIASYLIGGRVAGPGQGGTREEAARREEELDEVRRRLEEIEARLDRLLHE